MPVYGAVLIGILALAGVILFACFAKKKTLKIIGIVLCGLILSLAVIYLGLTAILLGGIDREPAEASSETESLTAGPTETEPEETEPEETEPAPEPLFTEIDHHVMRTDPGYYFKPDDVEYLNRLIDAVLTREPYVELSPSYDQNLLVLGGAVENPYWFFVEEERFNDDHTGLFLQYAYTPEEQAEMLNFMDSSYLEILNTVIRPEMNDTDKLLAIHHYFGASISYDYQWLQGLDMSDEKYLYPDIVIYEALKTGRGVCHTYTYLTEFALRQMGIQCLRMTGEKNGNPEDGHMWLLARLDGEYYHFDTTWDSGQPQGKVNLIHFGMTDQERREDGFGLEIYDFDTSYHGLSCTSTRFSNLRDVLDYSYLGDHLWKLETFDGEEYTYNTETGLRS